MHITVVVTRRFFYARKHIVQLLGNVFGIARAINIHNASYMPLVIITIRVSIACLLVCVITIVLVIRREKKIGKTPHRLCSSFVFLIFVIIGIGTVRVIAVIVVCIVLFVSKFIIVIIVIVIIYIAGIVAGHIITTTLVWIIGTVGSTVGSIVIVITIYHVKELRKLINVFYAKRLCKLRNTIVCSSMRARCSCICSISTQPISKLCINISTGRINIVLHNAPMRIRFMCARQNITQRHHAQLHNGKLRTTGTRCVCEILAHNTAFRRRIAIDTRLLMQHGTAIARVHHKQCPVQCVVEYFWTCKLYLLILICKLCALDLGIHAARQYRRHVVTRSCQPQNITKVQITKGQA